MRVCFDLFWNIFFYLFGVRVTKNIEVSYGALTVRITGGQSVKIQTTGGYIELEANHRWVMCNYPKILSITPLLQLSFLCSGVAKIVI